MIGYRRRNADAVQNTDADGNTKQPPVLIGFRAVYVFDVAQTEGEDLPEFEHNISGEVGEQRDRLIGFLAPASRSRRSLSRWFTKRRTYVVFAVMLCSGCEGPSSLGLPILDAT
jgi:hypothetical protein